MRIHNINNPELPAEGMCNGLPYTTATYNKDGCAIHFWIPGRMLLAHIKPALDLALHKAMNARDIIMASWSLGEPSGFWAHEDIE